MLEGCRAATCSGRKQKLAYTRLHFSIAAATRNGPTFTEIKGQLTDLNAHRVNSAKGQGISIPIRKNASGFIDQ